VLRVLFRNMKMELSVDGFRYLINLHTTIRCLSINSHLISIMGLKNLPSSILESMAIKWSIELEKESVNYRNRTGKLTEDWKPTTAFKHYLTLTKELGLSQKLNDIYGISRLGRVLLLFIASKDPFDFELSQYEKLFYLLILFLNDFDGISIPLSILLESDEELAQAHLQVRFTDKLKDRLLVKQKSADTKTKHHLLEKYKRIEFTWQNPKKYSEHTVVPRLEWLSDLDLVNIVKSKNSTCYKLLPYGKNIFSIIPFLSDHNTKDINEEWINSYLLSTITMNYENRIFWSEISRNEQIDVIGNYLDIASKELGSVGSHRISFYTSYIYISISLFIKSKIVLEKKDLKEFLLAKALVNNKIYSLHLAARKNEEYITFKYV